MKTSDPVKIIFSILTTYERSGWVHPSILQYFCDLPFREGHAFRVIPMHNFHPAASARNQFCKHFKNADADWLCMIDNDMEIKEDLLDTIKDAPEDAGIVVPAFYAWDQAGLKNTLCWGRDQDQGMRNGLGKFDAGWHELSKAGTGVIFIRPWVFDKISYPYFFYLYNEDCGMDGTEDIQFGLQANRAGVKIYGNTQVTVGHYHSVEISSMYRWMDKFKDTVQKNVDSKEEITVESPA